MGFRLTLRQPAVVLPCLGLVLSCATWSPRSSADPHVEQIAKRLADGSFFQVRVQAALALGASRSEAAVRPLCGALDDDVASVRAATAAALARLRKASALDCIKKRIDRETNGSVKTQLQRALVRIEKETRLRSAASASRTPTPKSRFYVAVDPVTSKGNRRKRAVELLVQATIRSRLIAEQNVGVAPSGQDKGAFGQLTQKHRIDGYLIRPTVDSIAYSGSNVSVAVRLTLFSYPAMALQAEYAPKLSMSGTSETDREAEDKLLQMAAEKATQRFLETFK